MVAKPAPLHYGIASYAIDTGGLGGDGEGDAVVSVPGSDGAGGAVVRGDGQQGGAGVDDDGGDGWLGSGDMGSVGC